MLKAWLVPGAVALLSSLGTLQAANVGQMTGISEYSGDVRAIDAPDSVRSGETEGNVNAKLFIEQSWFTIDNGIEVDTVPGPGLFSRLSDFQSELLTGRAVRSHFLHVDTTADVDENDQVWSFAGSVTFESPILGVIGLKDTFRSSGALNADGTSYPSRLLNDHDLDPTPETRFADSFSFDNDNRTIHFDWNTGGRMDQMRIITAVPEPGGFAIASILACGLGMLRRARRSRN